MWSAINEWIVSNQNFTSWTLIILLLINVIATVIKFVFDLIMKKEEVNIYKKNMIAERQIKIGEELFKKLERLSLFFNPNEKEELLELITEANLFKTQNRLFLKKQLSSNADDILDYFKTVSVDFRNKDVKKETDLYNGYFKAFHK